MKQEKNIGKPIFAAVLRSQMSALNWTQERVAAAADVSQASVNGWLTGSVPRADALYQLAKEMSVTMEFLLTGKNSVGGAVHLPDAELIRREERARLAIRLHRIAEEIAGTTTQAVSENESSIENVNALDEIDDILNDVPINDAPLPTERPKGKTLFSEQLSKRP